jgi:hypothetical protein
VFIVLGAAVALLGVRGGGAPLRASTTGPISLHAGSTTFQSGSASIASTAAPSDLRAGDVVVSYLETTSTSGVSARPPPRCSTRSAARSGWPRAWPGGGTHRHRSRLAHPAGPVAMVTLAFSGVDPQTPVDAQASSARGTSPPVRTTMAHDKLVFGEGSDATAATATAPTGSTLVRSLNNGARAQVAVAVMGTGAAGMVSGKHWAVSPTGSKPAAATIALRPATPTATPTPTPTTTTATTTPPGTPTTSTSTRTSTPTTSTPTTADTNPTTNPGPSAPNVVCGNTHSQRPVHRPRRAVVVPAGNNNALTLSWNNPSFAQAGKTFWFAPGVHTLGTGQYDQIGPGTGTTLIGAPGAIVDGQGKNEVAFAGTNSNVTIKYLTIQNFVGPNDQGTINHDQATSWTMTNNTIKNNKGAGIFGSDNSVINQNCITSNGQYGFQTFKNTYDGPRNIMFDGNEISFNNTDDVETSHPYCGCSGGGKFWSTQGVTFKNNYVHDNNGSGIWADTNDANFLIESNWFEKNADEGLFYELSYNVAIRKNVFKNNVVGPDRYGFDRSGLGFSEVSGDSRVAYSLIGSSAVNDISENLFDGNVDGIRIWENSDRFCNSPVNSSSGYCTLVNPSVISLSTCNATNIAREPYFTDCRWWSQNTKVHQNTFISRPGATDLNGFYANYGTTPSWSPYLGSVVMDRMTRPGNIVFSNNTYKGSWTFYFGYYSPNLNFQQWQAKGQDVGSTLTP